MDGHGLQHKSRVTTHRRLQRAERGYRRELWGSRSVLATFACPSGQPCPMPLVAARRLDGNLRGQQRKACYSRCPALTTLPPAGLHPADLRQLDADSSGTPRYALAVSPSSVHAGTLSLVKSPDEADSRKCGGCKSSPSSGKALSPSPCLFTGPRRNTQFYFLIL